MYSDIFRSLSMSSCVHFQQSLYMHMRACSAEPSWNHEVLVISSAQICEGPLLLSSYNLQGLATFCGTASMCSRQTPSEKSRAEAACRP